MAAIGHLGLAGGIIGKCGHVQPQSVTDIVAQTEKVYLTGIKYPTIVLSHTEKGDITTFSLRVYHIESVVTLVAAFLIGGTSTPFYLYQEGIFRMGGIGSGDADDGSTIVIGDDIGLAYLHDGDGGELQVIGGLSCIVGNGQGKTTSFADIAEAEGLIGNYLFPVNMYNGLGIRYADGGGIVIQTGGIGYNQ